MAWTNPRTWTTGELVTDTMLNIHLRDNLNALKNDLIPIGTIVLWYGTDTTVPSGWSICDGNNGTPNLSNRFVICAGNNYPKGSTGGAATKDISHTHTQGSTGAEASHKHSLVGTTDGALGNMSKPEGDSGYYQIPGAAHTHEIYATSGAGESHAHTNPTTESGGSATQDVMPPYYALYYIMRIS